MDAVLARLEIQPMSSREIGDLLGVCTHTALARMRPFVSSGEVHYIHASFDLREGPALHRVFTRYLPPHAMPLPLYGACTKTIHRSLVLDLLDNNDGYPLSVNQVASQLHCTEEAAHAELEALVRDRFIHRAGDEYEAYEEDAQGAEGEAVELPERATYRDQVLSLLQTGPQTAQSIALQSDVSAARARVLLKGMYASGVACCTTIKIGRVWAHQYSLSSHKNANQGDA